MSLLQIVVLTVVQGITEFLPISSSGHLVIVPWVVAWPDQGLDLDIAVHVGTLVAVILYFWRDMLRMVAGLAGGKKPEGEPTSGENPRRRNRGRGRGRGGGGDNAAQDQKGTIFLKDSVICFS